MHIEIAILIFILWCEFASTFNVLTYMAATSHVAGILRRVSDTLGLRFLHSTLSLVLMGIHNLVVTSAIWIEVIIFCITLYMWFTSVINPRVLCVSAYRSREHVSTETWPSEVGSLQDGIRAHVDCRTWPLETGKPIGNIFSTTFFSKGSFTSLLFWAYSNIPF